MNFLSRLLHQRSRSNPQKVLEELFDIRHYLPDPEVTQLRSHTYAYGDLLREDLLVLLDSPRCDPKWLSLMERDPGFSGHLLRAFHWLAAHGASARHSEAYDRVHDGHGKMLLIRHAVQETIAGCAKDQQSTAWHVFDALRQIFPQLQFQSNYRLDLPERLPDRGFNSGRSL